jgi:hypothetical protein
MIEEGEEDGMGGVTEVGDEEVEQEALNLLRLTTTNRGEAELSQLSDYQLTRLARRAEEEAELNRAILLSLQYANSAASATAIQQSPDSQAADVAQAAGATDSDRSNIDILLAMGFSEEQSREALFETGNNVELAANRLLGLDF